MFRYLLQGEDGMALPYNIRLFHNRNKILVFVYTVIFLFAGFELFYNLDDRLLWDDEAETALLAENIIKFGLPKITDGKNFVVLDGVEANKNGVWTISPWLQNYITALSFLALGKTTLAARVPFAALGFLSIIFLAFITYRIYHRHELTITVILLYVTCVGFLLHARQCRYYSILMFAQLWMIYGYWLLIRAKKSWGTMYVALALATQFYCHYLIFSANVLALCVTTVINHRRFPGLLWALPVSLVCCGALTVPWLIYAEMWNQRSYMAFDGIFVRIFYYLWQTHFFIIPLVLFLVPPVVFAGRLIWPDFKRYCVSKSSCQILAAGGKAQNVNIGADDLHKVGNNAEKLISQGQIKAIEVLLWILVPTHLLALSSVSSLRFAYFRYLVPMIPVLDILGALILFRYFSCRLIRYPIIALLCLTNIIPLASAYPLRGKLKPALSFPTFLQEITTDYGDRLNDVVLFFKNNADDDDSIYAFDNELSLIFHTDLHIIDARFNREPILMHNLPDWILTKSASGLINYPNIKLQPEMEPYYEPIRISIHDTSRFASRPDPYLHVPFTVSKFTEILIYKKVR